ncbi:MAG: hypothetical protein LH614_12975 [Pyrinomonadaceae bacterium]|nr:hypothetical protein [Pyrinomonadaceae bacterium]
MKKEKAVLLFLVIFLCSTFFADAQTKRAKVKSQAAKVTAVCKSNKVSFPCPEEYKIVLNGNDSTGIFSAQNLEFGYSVFLIAPKDNFDKPTLMTDAIKTLLKTLYPKKSQNYRWKDVEFANKKASSKFEINKKSSIGFNGNQIVTIDYRHILFEGKNVVAGTIVNGFFEGYQAESEFNEGRYTTNGGCFDAVKIIHSITSEKDSDELDPCGGAIIIERKNL